MPLQKQNLSIPLAKGLDTKTDPKQLAPGVLSALTNGVFTSPQEIAPRSGGSSLSTSIAGGGSLSAGNSIHAFQNTAVLTDGTQAYAYSQNQGNWPVVGPKLAVTIEASPVIANTTNKVTQDSAILASGIQVVTWEDQSGGSRYSVIDTVSGTFLVSNAILSATFLMPKPIYWGSNFYLFCLNPANNNIYCYTIPVANLTTLSGPTQITSDGATGSSYDAVLGASTLYLVYQSTNVKVLALNSFLSVTNSATTTLATGAVTAFLDSTSNNVWVASNNSGTGIGYAVYSSVLSSIASGSVSDTSTIRNLTGCVVSGLATILYEVQTSQQIDFSTFIIQPQNARIMKFTANTSGVQSAPASFLRSVGLGSKIFLNSQSTPQVVVTHDSTAQGGYFLCSLTGKIGAKISPQTGGGLTTKSILPQVSQLDPNVFSFPYLKRVNTNSTGTVITYQTAVYLATLTYQTPVSGVNLANNLHLSGGFLSAYDGNQVVEHGFHLFPDSLVSQQVTMGGMAAGTYSYVACYEWFDSQGNWHRSAPSLPLTVTIQSPQAFISTTNASTSVGLAVTTSQMLYAGMAISGTNIPAGATVSSVTSNTGLTISAAATATSAGLIGTFTSQVPINVTPATPAGGTILDNHAFGVTSPTNCYVACNLTSGSNQAFFYNGNAAVVGATVTDTAGNIPGSTTITAFTLKNGGALVTLSNNATGSFQGEAVLVTNSGFRMPASAFLYVGQTIAGSGLSITPTILAINGNVLTIDQTAIHGQLGCTVSGGYGVGITVPTLRLSDKLSSTTPVQIGLYRTKAGGTVYYRVATGTNDATVDSVLISDQTHDAAITGNQSLYTNGEVENISPPGCSIVSSFKSRVIVVPSEDPYTWWPSKQVIEGYPAEFSDFLKQSVDAKGGPIGAIGVMDEKLILFKESAICFTAGDGPAPSGLNSDWFYPQTITSDNGCSNPKSVVLTPLGLMYQASHNKGIYLLDRSLSSSYVGAPMEAYNSHSVTSAELVPNTTQARFNLDNGTALVFDYYTLQWGVFSNVSAVDSTIYNGNVATISSLGLVTVEDPAAVTDSGSAISLSLTTGWISMAQVQGYQRIRRLLILGKYLSQHTLTVGVAYDFDPTLKQTTPITVTTDPNPYQFEVHLEQQKCQAVQFTLTITPSGTLGLGASISSLAMEVGVKQGLNKIGGTKSYG